MKDGIRSTFFHVGVNLSNRREYGVDEPQVRDDGSISWVPLPNHKDPDLLGLTYGDPWGRLGGFAGGDIAWFIETGTRDGVDAGYYIVQFFVIEDVYRKRHGVWNKHISEIHKGRIAHNAHELRGDRNYSIILGDASKSRALFQSPVRLTKGQDAYPEFKKMLGLSPDMATTGYWFKRWFGDASTRALLKVVMRTPSI